MTRTTPEADRILDLIDARISETMLAEHERTNRLRSGRLRVKRLPITPPEIVRELQELMQSALIDQTPQNLLRIEQQVKSGDMQNEHLKHV